MYHGCTVVEKRYQIEMIHKALLKKVSEMFLLWNERNSMIRAAIKESAGAAVAMILYPVIHVPIHLTI